MGIINLEDIQEGMILENDIKDRNGRILLAGGSKISEKHLRVFKMWGVTEADIRGVEKEELTANVVAHMDPVLLQEAESRIRERFYHQKMDDPFIMELFRLLTFRMVKRGPYV